MSKKKGGSGNTEAAPQQQHQPQHQQHGGHRRGSISHQASRLSLFDNFSIVWLALSGWIHMVLEGAFVYNNKLIAKSLDKMPASIDDYQKFYYNQLPASNGVPLNLAYSFVDFLRSLWKNYSCGDTRYAISDNFIINVEGVTACVAGPLCFVLIFAIAYKRPWRHALQLVLCTMQLYGLGLYFLIEHYDNYTHVNTKSIKCYYFYYWFFNLLWLFVPGVMWLKSFSAVSNAFSKVQRSEGQPTVRGGYFGFLLKLFIGANIMGMSLVLLGAFGSHYLDDAIAKGHFDQLLHAKLF